MSSSSVPVIDVQPLLQDHQGAITVARSLGHACREFGFFYVSGHGISEELQQQLVQVSQQFFALPQEEKMKIQMALGGKAWRGYFPVGGELTAGKPDLKEGLYFGAELGPDHPKVQTSTPLHGANLFPSVPSPFQEVVLEYLQQLTQLGHHLMRGFSLSLGLDADYFSQYYTTDPLVLFRIFHYPSAQRHQSYEWGVGEHTDYGVLTILKQDETGGLQIFTQDQWIEAPYIPGTFVCNIGDMLERLTQGLYRSTPHRVRNTSQQGRLSFPFFFDPNFDAEIKPLPIDIGNLNLPNSQRARWDGVDVHTFSGTYGDYILEKVAKVFPELQKRVSEE